jgi:hypothetical protein
MTPEFLAAVIDTLLPGEQAAPPGTMPLPRGTQADLDPAAYSSSHRAVLNAIAAQAGSCELFVRADESARDAILKAVERAMPDAFGALLATVLSDYYEAPPVLAALRWRIDPPQPTGHALPTPDIPTAERLERARRRGKLWRG